MKLHDVITQKTLIQIFPAVETWDLNKVFWIWICSTKNWRTADFINTLLLANSMCLNVSAARQIYSKSSEVLLLMEENTESNELDGPTSKETGCPSWGRQWRRIRTRFKHWLGFWWEGCASFFTDSEIKLVMAAVYTVWLFLLIMFNITSAHY
jgi:hypothetical protein